MIEIVCENFGSKIAIGIKGSSKEDIENFFYPFWLHKITNGTLEYLTDKFAYFWTSPKNFIDGTVKREHHKLCLKTGMELEGPTVVSTLRRKAEETLKDLIENHQEHFIEIEVPIYKEFKMPEFNRGETIEFVR